MYRPIARKASIVRGLSFMLVLVALTATRAWMPATTRAESGKRIGQLPDYLSGGSPSRCALHEAAFWWSQAVQVANDEYDDERAGLQVWDPGATRLDRVELSRLLACDHHGYLRRSWGAARRAAAVARTRQEAHRAARQLVLLRPLRPGF